MTPPRLAVDAARAWDSAVDAARLRIMSDEAIGRTPQVGLALQLLSDGKARLPMKAGGLGHYSAELLSPISFYSAYAHHAFLDKGTRERLLDAELGDTIQRLLYLLMTLGFVNLFASCSAS